MNTATSAAVQEKVEPRAFTRSDYERHLPMVRRIAMRLARRLPDHITTGDLISAGWVGLMEAYSRSETGMPVDQFAAYASHRVRGAMLDYLRQLDPATRRARSASRKVARAIAALTQEFGRAPEEEEIAAALGLEPEAYRDLLTSIASAGMTRLDIADFDHINALPSKLEPPDEIAERRLMVEAVAQAIEFLPERLRLVVALYYQESCTLREIGEVLGVSESRACQLHSEAMHRLRAKIGKE